MSEPQLRASTKGDEPAVRRLLAEVLPGNPKADERIMRWQYHDNPYGDAMGWVWEDGGRIVGCYTAVPVPFLVGGEPTRGVVSVDAATADGYRGRGLFSAIIEESERVLRERGFSCAYFFPAALSMLPHRAHALGWPFRTYVLPLNTEWFAERLPVPPGAGRTLGSAMFRRPSGDADDVGATVPDDVGTLWEQLRPRLEFGIVKDETWWRWRYGEHPLRPYRFVTIREQGRLTALGAAVDRNALGGRVVYVLELLAVTRADARRAVGALVSSASDDVDAVAMLALPGTPQARAARGAGLRPVPRRLEANPVWLAVYDIRGEQAERLSGPWAATWGDMDHL